MKVEDVCTRDAIESDESVDPRDVSNEEVGVEGSRRYSRRDLFALGAMVSALLTSTGCPPQSAENFEESLDPDEYDKGIPTTLRTLVDRTTFGATKADLDLAKQLGYQGYLEYQLDYEAINDSPLNSLLSTFSTLNLSPKQIVDRVWNGDWTPVEEFFNATILRSAYSNRQLYQRMVEFWTDHFNIYIEKNYGYILKQVDDREVIRPYAMTTFPELLSASMHSPAMLSYLDNDPSSKELPNQNYAREMMELHTIGVDNFTQKDVEEVARCITGFSLNFDYESPDFGKFRFYRWAHDQGRKKVLGYAIPRRGGASDGNQLVDILTRSDVGAPLTARHLAKKMANMFWGYNPPQELVDSIANAYLANDGDIKAMIRAALDESWIASAPPKLKRPYHYVMSILRAVPSQINSFWTIYYSLDTMGHVPYQWAPPNGYPDALPFWSGYLLPRWNFGQIIFLQDDKVAFDLSSITRGDPTTDQLIKRLSKVFFNGKMPKSDKDLLAEYLEGKHGDWGEFRQMEAIGLAVSMSGFQWY